MRKSITLLLFTLLFIAISHAQNQPEREQWLQDAGFGMFIHWSMDAQLGTVISHSLVGASEAYTQRYFEELPKTFNPTTFDAERMARLAKLAGMKYMVFTAKHHSGFCMWDTETTGFNIMKTPYGKDVVREYVEACRKHGLAVGLYYSPEDFWYLHETGEAVKRSNIEGLSPEAKQKYIEFVKAQCRELLSLYGEIDVLFFDGGENFLIDALKPMCWDMNPDVLITRGEIETPEQYLPGIPSERVWESCMTMGTQWQFKPTNETYKPGGHIIRLLVETRAKGGALLLNIGPDAFGEIPFEQERKLTEVAAWYFINQEAITKVRPWIITNEGPIWFTRKKEGNTVYAVIFGESDWALGTRKEFTIHSVKAGPDTKITVLGQSGERVEYQPEIDATSRFEQTNDGLKISVVRAQRIYNNRKWPNPIVVKLENVSPALSPPMITTANQAEMQGQNATLNATLLGLGDAETVEIGFEYRPKPNSLNELTENKGWKTTSFKAYSKAGAHQQTIKGLPPGLYQYRALVRHPRITIPGEIYEFEISE